MYSPLGFLEGGGGRFVFLLLVEDDLGGFRGNSDSHSLWQILSLVVEVPNEDVEQLIRREVVNARCSDHCPFGQNPSLGGDEYEAGGLARTDHWCLFPGVEPLCSFNADRGVISDLE